MVDEFGLIPWKITSSISESERKMANHTFSISLNESGIDVVMVPVDRLSTTSGRGGGKSDDRAVVISFQPESPSEPIDAKVDSVRPDPTFLDDMRLSDWRKGVNAVFDSYRLR